MKHILGQNAFWIINKSIAKQVGIDAALLLSDLISKEEYFESLQQSDYDGWFYNTSDNIETDTTLKRHKQEAAIKQLVDNNFIDVKLKGVPPKRHFKIATIQIAVFLQIELPKNSNIYNNNTINKNKVIINIPFVQFWDLYDKKINKPKCNSKWNKLTNKQRTDIINYLPKYIISTPDRVFRKHPFTFLNNNSWEDEIITKDKTTKEYIPTYNQL